MVKAIRTASKVVIRDFGEIEKLQVSLKGPGDFVTASDKKVEKILITELQKARPRAQTKTELKWLDKSLQGQNRNSNRKSTSVTDIQKQTRRVLSK